MYVVAFLVERERSRFESWSRNMTKHNVIPNMPGSKRPQLTTDALGYPSSIGDDDWNAKLKKLYVKVPGGWRRKCECCDSK
jgi:hypothetical protein